MANHRRTSAGKAKAPARIPKNKKRAGKENKPKSSNKTKVGKKNSGNKEVQKLRCYFNKLKSPEQKRRVKSNPEDSIVVGDVVGDYKIVKMLGGGDNGVCFDARTTDASAKVALKFQNRTDNFNMIKNELGILKKLKRNNGMLKYLDDFNFGKYNVIVTNLLNCDLSSQLDRYGKICSQNVLRVGYDLMVGLDFLRNKKIVHRDIHPGNVFFDANFTRTVLGDFGCAEIERCNKLNLVFNDLPHISHRVNEGEEYRFLDDTISVVFLMLEMSGEGSLFRDKNFSKMVEKKKKLFNKPLEVIERVENKILAPIVHEIRRQFLTPKSTHNSLLKVLVKETGIGFDPKKKYATCTRPVLHLV